MVERNGKAMKNGLGSQVELVIESGRNSLFDYWLESASKGLLQPVGMLIIL